MLKRKELLNHEKTWRNLKCILLILSKGSPSEKATYYMIPAQNDGENEKIRGC